MSYSSHHPSSASTSDTLKLAVGALGVVFGDIGTSPLYAVQACFEPTLGLSLTPENILGIISLFFWSLLLVVTIKYLTFILRADNHGEGGIMALIALLLPKTKDGSLTKRKAVRIITLGLFGAALLYGDGIITPAISVLSAIEGLKVATPALHTWVVPITVAILVGLFIVQKKGTTSIGAVFGPATLIWFFALIAIGLPWIVRRPDILLALNPWHALDFFYRNGLHGFLTLSAVVLCITGGEALYADMGHFGKKPIRLAWLVIVFPALLINYLGQGALLLEKGKDAVSNPFYSLVGDSFLIYPLVFISTVATVIASQALISGAYSLTQQAVQLGYLPRVFIAHTSRQKEGQIYVPSINWFLMIACVALVVFFQDSSKLAAAYGIAVTGTMGVTSILFYSVVTHHWGWKPLAAVPLVALFLILDLAFFISNATKIHHGGWIPLVIAGGIFVMMTTWKKGREILARISLSRAVPLDQFIARIGSEKPHRISGTAVFMMTNRNIASSVLLHHYRHNQVLHQNVILLSILTQHSPEVPQANRVRVTEFEHGFFKVVAHYGYMETPDVSEILEACGGSGLQIDLKDVSFYLGRETFVVGGESALSHWRKQLFLILSRNARPATEFFKIPPDRVIELGSQIKI
jgi:KUP system potassium uptake protein